MNILGIIGIAVITAILCAMLRKYHVEYAILVGIAAGIFLTLQIILQIEPVITQISGLLNAVPAGSENLAVLLKALGICLLTEFTSDSCIDAGEKALASRVELAGKIAIVILALPLFEKLMQTVVTLTGG